MTCYDDLAEYRQRMTTEDMIRQNVMRALGNYSINVVTDAVEAAMREFHLSGSAERGMQAAKKFARVWDNGDDAA